MTGDGDKLLVIEGFEMEINGSSRVYSVIGFGQVAEGEEKVRDDGGNGSMVAVRVGASGCVDLIRD